MLSLMAERHIQIFKSSLLQVNLRILLLNICVWLNCYWKMRLPYRRGYVIVRVFYIGLFSAGQMIQICRVKRESGANPERSGHCKQGARL